MQKFKACNIVICNILFYSRPTFTRGEHTLSVPMELFAQNRRRLCESLRATGKVPSGAIVLLQGGVFETRNCSDHEPLFRQVMRLHYLFCLYCMQCF